MKYFFVGLFLISILGCNSFRNEECLDSLENRLDSKLNSKSVQGEVINIRESITCFDWDSLLIESGYATKESIKKYYNLQFPYRFNSSSSDGNCLIFFIKDNVIVRHIDYEITCENGFVCKTYDFRTLIKMNKNAIIAKKDAVFEVYTQEVADNRGNLIVREDAIRLKKLN